MRGLHAIAWRGLWARPLRTALTTIGVALGVAVLFAGLATNAGIGAAIERTVATQVGRADLRLEAFGETGLSPETRIAVAATPGVVVVAPSLEHRTYLDLDPNAAGGAGTELPPPVTIVGVDPTAEPVLHDLPLASGTWLGGPREPTAVISASLAAQDRLALGQSISFLGTTGTAAFRIVGILADDGPWATRTDRTVVVPLATAQVAFGTTGVTRLDLGLADDATATDVTAALESALTRQPYVLSTPGDLAAGMRASTADFAATTALIAAVALFAGAFLIFNTLSMTVIERVRELGLLRAAGATRSQLTSFILLQAVVIGVLGTIVGVAFGAILATAMSAWLRTIGSVELGSPSLALPDMVTAFGIGLVVTIAAALEPARRAGRIPPVEALKARLELPTARRARLRWLVVVFVTIGVVGLVLWPRDPGETTVVRALIVYAVLLLATLAVPFVLPSVARLAGLAFRAWRLEERLARASVLRDRSRSALTVGALTVGLAMIVALGGVAGHARAAAAAWIADVVPGDLVVTSIFPRTADEGLVDTLGVLPGVARVSPFATFDVAIDGVRADGAAVSGTDLAADGRLRFVAGDRLAALTTLDRGGAVVVPAAMAARAGIGLDTTLSLTAADGTSLPLRVVGIADRTLPGRGGESVLVGWPDAPKLAVAGADAYAVRFATNATPAERAGFGDEARALALEPTPLDQIQGAVGEALDRVFGLFDALALVAVVVAALGIVNTLTMNVLERVREIGVLRAAGMTRRQVWRSVVVEAGITGLVGAGFGVLTGCAVGATMVLLAGGRLDIAIALPWSAIAVAVVGGVTLAMLAAAYPARLASGVSIVRAVGYE
jgi:putative ABC transport system permease protein